MKYDYKQLYQKNADFYNRRPKAKKALFIANLALPALYALAYLGLVLYAVFSNFDNKEFIGILFIPAFTLLCVMAIRLIVDRERPYSEKGANIVPLLVKKSKDKESFPSRHTASATVIALTILPYCLGAGICLLAFIPLLCYIRFALGLHYPSDLLAGSSLGALCALLYLL